MYVDYFYGKYRINWEKFEEKQESIQDIYEIIQLRMREYDIRYKLTDVGRIEQCVKEYSDVLKRQKAIESDKKVKKAIELLRKYKITTSVDNLFEEPEEDE